MPFVTIYEDKWIAFSHSYDKYFIEKDVLTEIKRDYRRIILDSSENENVKFYTEKCGFHIYRPTSKEISEIW